MEAAIVSLLGLLLSSHVVLWYKMGRVEQALRNHLDVDKNRR